MAKTSGRVLTFKYLEHARTFLVIGIVFILLKKFFRLNRLIESHVLRAIEPQTFPHKGVKMTLPEGSLPVHVLVQHDLILSEHQGSWEGVTPPPPQPSLGSRDS